MQPSKRGDLVNRFLETIIWRLDSEGMPLACDMGQGGLGVWMIIEHE